MDSRRLNNVTKHDAEVMPNIEDLCVDILAEKKKYFLKIDLSKQIPLTKATKQRTAFVTPTGLYQFKVMPLGLADAPAVLTRLMRKLRGP